jgi:hypothetical protein
MSPVYDREAVLADVRLDPTGWGAIDLGTLLAEWGCRNKPLGSTRVGVESVLWYFPDRPHSLYVVLHSTDPLPVSIVESVIWIIDEIRWLQGQSGGTP